MKRAVIIALLLLATPAQSATIPPCWKVEAYVLLYGEAAAIVWAKKKGYTAAEIEALKQRCKV
jgi:hypothetical protein